MLRKRLSRVTNSLDMLASQMEQARQTFDPAGAGALLITGTAAGIGAGALIGWAAGSASYGLLGGAFVGIPPGVFAVYRRYRGPCEGVDVMPRRRAPAPCRARASRRRGLARSSCSRFRVSRCRLVVRRAGRLRRCLCAAVHAPRLRARPLAHDGCGASLFGVFVKAVGLLVVLVAVAASDKNLGARDRC